MAEHGMGDRGWLPPVDRPLAFGEPIIRRRRPDPATWGSRVGATLLDGVIAIGVLLLLVIMAAILGDAAPSSKVLSVVVSIAWPLVYAPLMLAFNRGQTLGKAMVGIRVVNDDGRPIGLVRAFLREGPAKWLCAIIPLIDSLWPLARRDRKALHDLVVQTWVIRD